MALAVPTGRTQQRGFGPGPEQRQQQGRRRAGGSGTQEPGSARPDPGAHPARWAQQRQQPGHGARRSAAAGAADPSGNERRWAGPAGARAQSDVGGTGAARTLPGPAHPPGPSGSRAARSLQAPPTRPAPPELERHAGWEGREPNAEWAGPAPEAPAEFAGREIRACSPLLEFMRRGFLPCSVGYKSQGGSPDSRVRGLDSSDVMESGEVT